MQFFRHVDKFTHAMLGDLTPVGVNWARAGTLILVVGAAMAARFGWEVSVIHALFLAGVVFIVAFGPEAAYRAFTMRKWFIATVASVFTFGMFILQLGVDQSYTAGARGKNRDETKVQNSRYTGAQESVTEDAANLKFWRDQKAALIQERASIISADPWSVSVSAEALRSEAATLEGKIKSETAGGRDGRKAGCKKVCEQLQEQKNETEKKVAKVEALSEKDKAIVKLDGQIASTQKTIDTKRTVAGSTEYKSSAVEHSNNQIASTVAFLLGGNLHASDEIKHGADISINSAMAFAAAGGHALCFLIAGGLYRRQDDEATGTADRAQPFHGVSLPPPLPAQPGGSPFDTLEMFHKAYQMRLAA